MEIIKKIKSLFTYDPPKKEIKIKTIKDLDIFDSVWIEDDGNIYDGWVFDITRRCIVVVYGNDLKDFRFQIPKPINVTEIVQGNKKLYCNERRVCN